MSYAPPRRATAADELACSRCSAPTNRETVYSDGERKRFCPRCAIQVGTWEHLDFVLLKAATAGGGGGR